MPRIRAGEKESESIMKKAILIALSVLVLLFVVVIVGTVLFLDSIVKKGVESAGPVLTKTEVKLAGVSISPMAGRAVLQGFLVGNPAGFKTPSAIQVGHIDVSLRLGSLLSDTIEVDHIRVVNPEITVEGGMKTNNLTAILANIQGPGAAAAPAEPAAGSKRLRVKEVTITGGKVNLNLAMFGSKSAPLNLPDIRLQNVGMGGAGATPAELAAQIMSQMTGDVTKLTSVAVEALGKTISGAGKSAQDAAKTVTDEASKAVKGVSDLFKKRQ